MTSFSGFPQGTRSIPVPAPLLGPLLEAIGDIEELKCTLRFLWLVSQQKGHPRQVAEETLAHDPVLLAALGSPAVVRRGLGMAVDRGTLLVAAQPDGEPVYLLNTPENRRVADALGPPIARKVEDSPRETAGVGPPPQRPNIFALYEENIGMLTPLVADELRDAEEQYPEPWIMAAFREAVDHNKRSWRYIARILERWATEGRGDGEPRRHSETLTAAEYIRRYGLPRKP